MCEKELADKRLESNRDFFRVQRDKHLEQWMAINGRASFGVIALVASAWVGVHNLPKFEYGIFSSLAVFLVALGAVLLVRAIVVFSRFHTSQIDRLQRKMASPDLVELDDCRIIQPEIGNTIHPHHLVLAGLILLGSGTLILAVVQIAAVEPKASAGGAVSISIMR